MGRVHYKVGGTHGKVKITLNDPQGDGKVYGQYDPGSGDVKIGGSTGDIAKGPLKGIDLGVAVEEV